MSNTYSIRSLLGAWPPDLVAGRSATAMRRLAERLEAYMVKAAREAKEETSWSNPNADYEAALLRFVATVLDAARPNPFLAEFHRFVGLLARPAAIASLSQLVLKLTVPGVPDIYQGGELWDFSLVDPDNRRPVDWARRRALLDETDAATPADLARLWQDGREKLFATRRLLELRRALPELFAAGDYRPLEVIGAKSNHFAHSRAAAAAGRSPWRRRALSGASIGSAGKRPIGPRRKLSCPRRSADGATFFPGIVSTPSSASASSISSPIFRSAS